MKYAKVLKKRLRRFSFLLDKECAGDYLAFLSFIVWRTEKFSKDFMFVAVISSLITFCTHAFTCLIYSYKYHIYQFLHMNLAPLVHGGYLVYNKERNALKDIITIITYMSVT